jgi:alkylation response protein AidB-like acyl-CoA dehydrogenase
MMMTQTFLFESPPAAEALREQVRTLIQTQLARTDPVRRANCWMRHDADFSRALGQAGFIGMVWPKRYGGHERSPAERYIVLEELLAEGAPVCGHWVADRQSGPLILKYGTEEQKRKLLPGIARGETFFCIGLSEPGSGSDLASVRTRARRTDEGWRISGQKIWSTNAHRSQYMIALVRTGEEERHVGLSQFIIDLATPGITINPIVDLTGSSEFTEVFFDDVLVPDDMLIGAPGEGWKQVTAELALERSGPERYLTSFSLLNALIRYVADHPREDLVRFVGQSVAELWTLRQMSMSTAAKLSAGEDPAVEAAIVKDLGTSFEQMLPATAQALLDDLSFSDGGDLGRLLAYLMQVSPSFSLRGGTREILRGIIARGLGLR